MAEQTEQLNLFFELCDDGSVEEHRFSDCQNKIFLVGCYKMNSKNQLGWMMSPQDNGVDCRYNVRLDKGRDGWVNSSNPRVSKPDFVILYDIDSPYATPLTYRVLNSSVTTENQMREMAYPEPRGNYLVYKLKRVEIVGNLNIPEVIAFKNTNRQHIDGKPIYIYGKEMSNINHKQQTKTRHHSNDNLIFQDKDMPTIETVITNSKKDSIHLASHLTSLDLFSGCGGLTKGFEMAGIRSIFASDIDENCAKTFALNFPNTPFLCKDITLITKEEVDALTGGIVPDVIIGGPPCQGFSLANKRRNQVADDPRNKLFYGFVKFIDWYSPKAFVMENVKGLLSMQNGEVLKTIISAFANAGEFGYDVQYKVLLASDYGVPQNRERVILIGTRKDLGLTPTHPQPNTTNKITVTEAISDLPQIGAGEGCDVQKYPIEPQNEYQKLMRAHSCYVTNHIAMKHTPRLIERFKAIKPGQSLIDVWETHGSVKRGAPSEKSSVKFGQNNQRLRADQPAPTIAASFQSNFIHPTLDRNFTAREGARLQSFPDDFVFAGMRTKMSWEKGLSQYQQIGNAVPVLMAKAIGDCIVELLK